jgi:hypothetical protein
MNNYVYALAVSGSTLYAGGGFTTAGGSAANYIAQWNGSSWSALGSGMNNYVYALAVSGSTLFAGGYFTTEGGSAAHDIAQWNGGSWSALGSGMNNYVYALAVSGSTLYAGGGFTTAGTNVSAYGWHQCGFDLVGRRHGFHHRLHAGVRHQSDFAGGLADQFHNPDRHRRAECHHQSHHRPATIFPALQPVVAGVVVPSKLILPLHMLPRNRPSRKFHAHPSEIEAVVCRAIAAWQLLVSAKAESGLHWILETPVEDYWGRT